MTLTLIQKRFLILWILFHSFALFVNLFDIRGNVVDDIHFTDTTYYRKSINLLTDTTNKGGFWPFVNYSSSIDTSSPINHFDGTFYKNIDSKIIEYKGIFSCYRFLQYITYIILGLLIIILPKLWK